MLAPQRHIGANLGGGGPAVETAEGAPPQSLDKSGYRQQARVENGFFRYKSVLGGGLKARHKAQSRKAAIGCHILNRLAEFGRPKSYALVS